MIEVVEASWTLSDTLVFVFLGLMVLVAVVASVGSFKNSGKTFKETSVFWLSLLVVFVLSFIGMVVSNIISTKNFDDHFRDSYGAQLEKIYGLELDEFTYKTTETLFPISRFPIELNDVGTIHNNDAQAVYWLDESGERQFAQVVARVVDSNHFELVSVSGERPIPLAEIQEAH